MKKDNMFVLIAAYTHDGQQVINEVKEIAADKELIEVVLEFFNLNTVENLTQMMFTDLVIEDDKITLTYNTQFRPDKIYFTLVDQEYMDLYCETYEEDGKVKYKLV